jgi:hypothetical protein
VACWGSDAFGQCSAPARLGFVTAIAAGARHTVVALEDGTIVAWGDGTSGQCSAPTHVARAIGVAAGRAHSLAVACTEGSIDVTTGSLGPIGDGHACERTLYGFPPAVGAARVTVRARADLGGAGAFLTLRLNGVEIGRVFESGARACPGEPDEQSIEVGEDLMNLALVAGIRPADALADLRVRIEASPGVKLEACAAGDVECVVRYDIRPRGCFEDHFSDPCDDIAASRDCDGNGRRDACDILAGAEDSDGDGLLDSCERARADLNLDGIVDTLDLDELMTVWWATNDPAQGDFDHDGAADAHDLAMLLAAWGELDW